MKKYVASLLIAIMAVSVLSAAGVVTTQKAAAGVPQPSILVTYKPRATYKYAHTQFNDDGWFTIGFGGATVSAAASDGVASSSISTTSAQHGESFANVGIYWQLRLPSTGRYSTWASVNNMPCTVTMTVSYGIHANGDQYTHAYAFWGPIIGPDLPRVSVNGYGSAHAKPVTTTTHTTVGALFSGGYANAIAGVESEQSSAGAGQASGSIYCSSIVLQF